MFISCLAIWTSNDPTFEAWRNDQPLRVYVDGVEIPWCVSFDEEEGWAEHLVLNAVTGRPQLNSKGFVMWDRVRGNIVVIRESDED
jgi:hypothetical protein